VEKQYAGTSLTSRLQQARLDMNIAADYSIESCKMQMNFNPIPDLSWLCQVSAAALTWLGNLQFRLAYNHQNCKLVTQLNLRLTARQTKIG